MKAWCQHQEKTVMKNGRNGWNMVGSRDFMDMS